jgi:hypothetical protein
MDTYFFTEILFVDFFRGLLLLLFFFGGREGGREGELPKIMEINQL